MKRLFAIAAFLMASSAAQAQYTFEYGGKTIRIDPDRGTVSIPGVFDNTGRRNKRARTGQDSSRKQTPEQAKSEPQAPAVAPGPIPAPAPAPSTAPVTAEPAAVAPAPAKAPPDSAPATANVVPPDTSPPAQSSAATPAPPIQQNNPPAATAAPPVVATAPGSPPATAAAPTPVAAPKPNSPLGLWLTEEKEGKVRIEQCGANLCGYSVDPKSNENGEQVLINMRPGKDSKWSGRIVDPNTGSTYDSTIALKGPDTLRVQGCAFGGMFCGGQTWSRLN
ncbi:MAG TPA: DUF2147 domain-containing protein [Bradyrhizobium sp.]|jgi:uncharacterized protein (DUF2147 family)|uniref:DUF2147 domain-containing protein n=1 Tax=Bradyrhizobium sp. TaxID=376 RepID=UPI002C927120|nr:DUF2147 domain-containing protein [Bradyrhizobium sp.]HXB76010.1 DUF2147 domain-containing protein [Bradyrhizobium sp.]